MCIFLSRMVLPIYSATAMCECQFYCVITNTGHYFLKKSANPYFQKKVINIILFKNILLFSDYRDNS